MARNTITAVPVASQRLAPLSLRLANNSGNGGELAFAGTAKVGPHIDDPLAAAHDWIIVGRFTPQGNLDCFPFSIAAITTPTNDRFFLKYTNATRALSFGMTRGGASIFTATPVATPSASQLHLDGTEVSFMVWRTGTTVGVAFIDSVSEALISGTNTFTGGSTANQRSFNHLLDSVNTNEGSLFTLGALGVASINISPGANVGLNGLHFCRIPPSTSFANFPLSTDALKMALMRDPQQLWNMRSSDTIPLGFDKILSYGQYQRSDSSIPDVKSILNPAQGDKIVCIGKDTVGSDVGGTLTIVKQGGSTDLSSLVAADFVRAKIYPDYFPVGKVMSLPRPEQYNDGTVIINSGAAVVTMFNYDGGTNGVATGGSVTKNPWFYMGVIDLSSGKLCRPVIPVHMHFAQMTDTGGVYTELKTGYNSFYDWDNHTGIACCPTDDSVWFFSTGHGSSVDGATVTGGWAGINPLVTGKHNWETAGYNRLQDAAQGATWQSIDTTDGTGIAPWGTTFVKFNNAFTGDLGNESLFRQTLVSYGMITKVGDHVLGQFRSRDTTAGRVGAFQMNTTDATGGVANRLIVTDIGPTWQGPLPVGIVPLTATKGLLLNTVRYDGDSGYLGTTGHIFSIGADFGKSNKTWAPVTGEPFDGTGPNALIMGTRFNFSGQNGVYVDAAKTLAYVGTPLTGYTPKAGDTLFIQSGTNMTTGYTTATVVSVATNNTFTMSASIGTAAGSTNVVVSGIFGNLKDYDPRCLLDQDNVSAGVLLTKDLCFSVYANGGTIQADGAGRFLYGYRKAKYADVRDLRWSNIGAKVGIRTFSHADDTNIITQTNDIDLTALISSKLNTPVTYLACSGTPGNFFPGETVTGGTSGATGKFLATDHNGSGAAFVQLLAVSGTFTATGETITGALSTATATVVNPSNQEAVLEALAFEISMRTGWRNNNFRELLVYFAGMNGTPVYVTNPQIPLLTNQALAKAITWKGRYGNAIWGLYTPNIWATTPTWWWLNNGSPVVTTDGVLQTTNTTVPVVAGGGGAIAPHRLGASTDSSYEKLYVEYVGEMTQSDLASNPFKILDMSTYIAAAARAAGGNSGGSGRLGRLGR